MSSGVPGLGDGGTRKDKSVNGDNLINRLLASLPQHVQQQQCQPSQFTISKIVLYILKRVQFWNTLPLTHKGWNPFTA